MSKSEIITKVVFVLVFAIYTDSASARFIQADPIGLEGGINPYAYVQNDPVNFIDPWGLARFGYRPLGDGTDRLAKVPDSYSDYNLAHEQLWFDDNPVENVGYFGGNGDKWGPKECGEAGDVRSDKGHSRRQYLFLSPVYNDDIMRKALGNIKDSWDGSSYCVAGHNCQHFSDALIQEYWRIKRQGLQ